MRSAIALSMSLSLPAFAAIAQDLAAIPTGVVQVDVAAARRQTLIDQIACHHVALAAKRPSGAAAMVATLASVGTPSSVVEQRRVESGVDDCMTARGYQAVAPTPEEEARLKTALAKDSHVDPWAVEGQIRARPHARDQGRHRRRAAGRRRGADLFGRPLLSAVIALRPVARYLSHPLRETSSMRADVEAAAADIEQSVGLLRRRL